MSADKMPPPFPVIEPLDKALSAFATACVYRGHTERVNAAAAVHEAACAYAAERVRELVEALERAEAYLTPRVAHKPHGEGASMLPDIRALIAKHKEST